MARWPPAGKELIGTQTRRSVCRAKKAEVKNKKSIRKGTRRNSLRGGEGIAVIVAGKSAGAGERKNLTFSKKKTGASGHHPGLSFKGGTERMKGPSRDRKEKERKP